MYHPVSSHGEMLGEQERGNIWQEKQKSGGLRILSSLSLRSYISLPFSSPRTDSACIASKVMECKLRSESQRERKKKVIYCGFRGRARQKVASEITLFAPTKSGASRLHRRTQKYINQPYLLLLLLSKWPSFPRVVVVLLRVQ